MSGTPRIEDLENSSFNPYIADEFMFGDHLRPPIPELQIFERKARCCREIAEVLWGCPGNRSILRNRGLIKREQ